MTADDSFILPNGCTLLWKTNEAGGRTYFSDEIGGGVIVWDTALVDRSSLLAAMVVEEKLAYAERMLAQRLKKEAKQDEMDVHRVNVLDPGLHRVDDTGNKIS